MKGLIVYSSLTGNTKKLAERLAAGLVGAWECFPIGEAPETAGYDAILIGGWIDRGHLDQRCANYFARVSAEQKVGLFGTLGAMPDSDHGKGCEKNLHQALEGHRSLGVKLLPGLVSKALVERVKKIPDDKIAPEVKKGMIEAGVNSRVATEEDYLEAIQYFNQALEI